MPSLKARRRNGTLSIRRTLFALIVSGVTLALVGGMLGFATATEATPETSVPSLPAMFGIPDARHGDLAVYDLATYLESEDGPRIEESRSPGGLSFGWGSEPDVYDDVGMARVGHVLGVSLRVHDHSAANYSVIFDDSSPRRPVQGTSDQNAAGDGASAAFPFESRYRWDSTWTSRYWSPQPSFFCPATNALQGNNVDTMDPIALFPPCNSLAQQQGPALFVATKSDDVDGKVRMTYEHPGNGDQDPHVIAVFENDVAYPIRLESGPDEEGRIQSFELSGWAQGAEPLRSGGPAMADAAPLAWTDTPPWGIDDASLVHPFKLSEAYTFARSDPSDRTFREWAEAHPDAFVQSARYTVSTSGGQVARDWAMEFSDGVEGYAMDVQAMEHPVYGMIWPSGAPPLPHGPYILRQSRGGTPDDIMPLALRPSHAPTAASLLARWADVDRSMGGDGAAGDSYGVGHFAPQEGQSSVAARVTFIAGLAHDASTVFPEGRGPTMNAESADGRLLDMEADGRMRTVFGMHLTWESAIAPAAKPYHAVDGGMGTPLAVQELATRHVTIWRVPAGPEAVNAGLVAAVAGLVFWLWPVLKTAFVAPFYSRVGKPQALDHPNRDFLHELVRADPGVHLQELARRTGWARGTLDHHLRKLVETGLVTEVVGEGYTCYFAAGTVDRRTMNAAPVLKSHGAQAILAAVRAHPGSSISEVARATQVTVATAHHHVRRLAAVGILRTERDGNASRLFVAA